MSDFDDSDDFEMLETDDITEKIKYKTFTVNLTEICCFGELTQDPNRMKDCESVAHTGMSYMGLPGTSLDGIIKVVNTKSNLDVFKTLNYEILRPKNPNDYVADHDGIMTKLNHDNLFFNLVSFNLEGLCRKSSKDPMYPERLGRFEKLMRPNITPGFIMTSQEIVLQLKDKIQQKTFLEENGGKIKDILNRVNGNIEFVPDGYTGGVFYDKKIWEMKESVEILRPGSDKRSNAYLFNTRIGNKRLWVVNIHLKAKKRANTPTRYSTLSSLMSYVGIESSDITHTKELSNILNHVEEKNKRFNYPVYFCGDYNTTTDKKQLFRMSMEELI